MEGRKEGRKDPHGGPLEGGTEIEVWGFAYNSVNGTFACQVIRCFVNHRHIRQVAV